MGKENRFSKKIKHKSISELQNYINNKENFHKDAVQAAIWEIEKRGITPDGANDALKSFEKKELFVKRNLIELLGIPVSTIPRNIRFVHFLIDCFVIQFMIYLISFIPYFNFNQLFSFIIFPIYYITFEYYTQRTPGKLISTTLVVDKNGERPELKTIVLRTFCRFIPFEAFSCLGTPSYGWHDKISQTYVINESDLTELREKSHREINGQMNS